MLPTTACSHVRLSNRLESTFLLPSHDRDGVVAAFCRGRDASFPTPPAQIRTCRIAAYGSYLG